MTRPDVIEGTQSGEFEYDAFSIRFINLIHVSNTTDGFGWRFRVFTTDLDKQVFSVLLTCWQTESIPHMPKHENNALHDGKHVVMDIIDYGKFTEGSEYYYWWADYGGATPAVE